MRSMTVAYRPKDDTLQIATEHNVAGDCIGVGRGVFLAIALDDGRPIGVLVRGFHDNGWGLEIAKLSGLVTAHMKQVRTEAVSEGIFDAVGRASERRTGGFEQRLPA